MAPDLQFRAAEARGSFDEAAFTIDAIVATATPVMRRDAAGPYAEVLDPTAFRLPSLGKGADVPLIDEHQRGSTRHVIGRAFDFRIEDGNVVATQRFSQADDVAPIIARVKDGTLKHFSVGYRVARWQDSNEGGRRIRTAVDWQISEVSLVGQPADPNARRIRNMPNDIEQTGIETPMPPENADAARVRAFAEHTASQVGFTDDEVDDFVRSGLGIDAVRDIAQMRVRERAAAQPRIRTQVGASNDDPAIVTRRMGDAMAVRMGGGEPAPELRAYLADPVMDLMKRSLEMAGVSTRGLSHDDIVMRAMTSSDFPIALGNAMGKVAADAYLASESVLKVLFKSSNLPNFKPSQSIRLGGMGRFEPLTESGEFRHTSRAENGETMKLGTYGQAISASRQLMIDDDLGLLGDMTAALGTAAAQTENDLIVATVTGNPKLSDNKAVFHATRGNIGTAGAPSLTTLDEARKAMRGRTDLDQKTLINVQPKYLVVGPELETEAEQLLAAIYASTTADVNPFSGRLTLLVEPRITDKSWYVFGDPARTPALQFAYLSSAPGVQIQRTEAWDVLGTKWRAWLDFGCGWLDWRGAQFNAGEA